MATHSSILAEKSHGQRSLVGCSPWGPKESDMAQLLNNTMNSSKYLHSCPWLQLGIALIFRSEWLLLYSYSEGRPLPLSPRYAVAPRLKRDYLLAGSLGNWRSNLRSRHRRSERLLIPLGPKTAAAFVCLPSALTVGCPSGCEIAHWWPCHWSPAPSSALRWGKCQGLQTRPVRLNTQTLCLSLTVTS